MKPNSSIFILFVIGSVTLDSISNPDTCSGRWQVIDNINIKFTLDWQIHPETNQAVIEFRTNLVAQGFWYAFGFSASLDEPTVGLVYALRWNENDTEVFWDIYNVTKSNVIIVKQNNTSLVTFQRLLSSGLLTVRPTINLTSYLIEQQCFYFVYMRGRFSGDIPLIPDEILFNRSLCLTCQQFELTSTYRNPTIEDTTTDLTIIQNSTIELVHDSTTKNLILLNKNILTSTFFQSTLSSNRRTEYKFFWFGRILDRSWSTDYFNFSSLLSQNLRLDLQNLFLFLINHNSPYSFLCNQFEFYSLQSGSILFASNITLISSLSENHTIDTIEKLIKTINNTKNFNLNFDRSAHHIKRANNILEIDILFKRFSRSIDNDILKQVEVNSALHLLLGCIVSISCLIIVVTTILCLYGYYKCRRRQLRLFTERQTLKFKHDTNSYTWLGQQPSISSSSPYLIQSTSI